jgi:nitrogenase iron protein NifH
MSRNLAFYGKGGIGKSTVSSTLAVLFAEDGNRVLLVGCDPKHDTSYKVVEERPVRTVMDLLRRSGGASVARSDVLVPARVPGLTCIETGGPEPGVGCAGRGITRMFELLAELGLPGDDFDVVIYDVLGDVVCGGFAAPIRGGHAEEVYVVASGEVMSLYAANNICRAVENLKRSGGRLRGLVPNLRGLPIEEKVLTGFSAATGVRLLPGIPRDPLVQEAETAARTIIEYAPDSATARRYREVYAALHQTDATAIPAPHPLDDDGFEQFIAETRNY